MTDILITGGTGSFGTHFVRQCLQDRTYRRVIVYSRDEWKQAQLAAALGVEDIARHPRLRLFLGDVRDPRRLKQAMRGVSVVVHAAALKRVDAGAYNPSEILKTNVLGTENVCVATCEAGVSHVVTLTSDKGVQPTNIYGTSKQFAEHLTVQANSYGYPQGTRHACVRYGNVLGSRGSVLHIWRAAVAAGQPIRLTDARMTRFWLTLDMACDLVRYALTKMRGGEIFVPKLHAAKLQDIATALAGPDYPVEVTGLRPGGEKLHEVLLSPHEVPLALDWGEHYIVPPEIHPWTDAAWLGDRLPEGFVYSSDQVPQLNVEALKRLLKSVP